MNRRGKRSIALNLKSDAGRAVAHDLLAQADALIEGFRPGVMERLGLGPEDVPDTIVYGRMTGWGQDGPLAPTAGHDLTYLAQTGVLSIMASADAPPRPPLNLIADYGGGAMFLIFGILSAVIARGRTGRGQVVDAAMVDGVPAMMGLLHGFMANGFWSDQPERNWLDGGAPFYRCYRCADGKDVAVAALEPQFYSALLAGLQLHPADLPDQNDQSAWPFLAGRFASAFAERPRDEWGAVFAGSDACVAPFCPCERRGQIRIWQVEGRICPSAMSGRRRLHHALAVRHHARPKNQRRPGRIQRRCWQKLVTIRYVLVRFSLMEC